MVIQYIINDLIFCILFESTLMKELMVGSEKGENKEADLMWFEELNNSRSGADLFRF